MLLHDALRYLSRGWSVIPAEPRGKRPLVPSWKEFQSRKASEQEVRAWWQRWPDANIAVITGAISGLVVVDVDGSAGERSVHGRELATSVISTTGRGTHYFFAHPGRPMPNRAGLLPGVDIRADGGYVIVPPSVHPSGAPYAWKSGHGRDNSLGVLPAWFRTAEPAPNAHLDRQSEWLTLLCGVDEGQRNDAAARLAGRLVRNGFSVSETRELLLLWNQRNRPPLPISEVRRVASSIALRESRRLLT